MEKKKKDGRAEQVAMVRSVVGEEYSEMDIIRALHMAHNDPTAAVNIIFDLPTPTTPKPPKPKPTATNPNLDLPTPTTPKPPKPNPTTTPPPHAHTNGSAATSMSDETNSKWWLVGSSEITGLSTCKGKRLNSGDLVTFSLPSSSATNSNSNSKFRPAIMRFSTAAHGEVGRIPNEWARCLIPLLREDKIMIQASCNSAPLHLLSIMDPINLSIR